MTVTKCPECGATDRVRAHCRKGCGLLTCTRCETIWTIDGHLVWNPASSTG